MTIRLFDPSAQKKYEQELETYDLISADRMKDGGANVGAPWPKYPRPPEAFADSKEEGTAPNRATDCLPFGQGFSGSAHDPRNQARDFDRDGSSQSDVEGFGVEDVNPFKLK